jgi:hypothetical protein
MMMMVKRTITITITRAGSHRSRKYILIFKAPSKEVTSSSTNKS